MQRRVVIQWTDTAKAQLAALPPKVRKGLLAKADGLETCSDPRGAYKPLAGPLADYYRITYSRYRAVYSVEDQQLASGDVLSYVRVCFIAAGKRKEHDKHDVYKIAEKMVELGLVDVPDHDVTQEPNDGETR